MSNSVEPIYQAGGALQADSLVYTKRGAEAETIQQLRRMAYLKLIEPRQQGKTSLINWLSGNMHTAGYSFAIADVSTLDISSEQAWYDSLYNRLARQVDFLSGRNDITLPKTSGTWRHFLADLAVSANQMGRRVVIALDEIGTTHQVWAEPFFRVLRDVFNNRQNEPYFRQLTFILAGCYNPANLIQQQHESPFNIAVRIRLPDFTYEKARILASHLQLSEERTAFLSERVYFWTGGQPYLTQLLYYYLSLQTQFAGTSDVDEAVQKLLYEDQNHLPPILATLRKKPDLQKYTERILLGEKIRLAPGFGNHLQAELELVGLIKADINGYCIIRNPIYFQIIKSYMNVEIATVAEQKTQQPSIMHLKEPSAITADDSRQQEHRPHTELSGQFSKASHIATEKEDAEASKPLLAPEKLATNYSNAAVKSKEGSSQAIEEEHRGGSVPTVKIISTALIVLAIISAIFLLVSVFSRTNTSFTPVDTIILLIIAAAIALGAVGIMNSEQITQVFTGSITSLSGNSTKAKERKPGETGKSQ